MKPDMTSVAVLRRRLAVEKKRAEKAEAEVQRLQGELEQARNDHHALGKWPDCPRCTKFFVDDEQAYVDNSKLRSRLEEATRLLREMAPAGGARIRAFLRSGDAPEGREAWLSP